MDSKDFRYNMIVGWAQAAGIEMSDQQFDVLYDGLCCEIPAICFPKKSNCKEGEERNGDITGSHSKLPIVHQEKDTKI